MCFFHCPDWTVLKIWMFPRKRATCGETTQELPVHIYHKFSHILIYIFSIDHTRNGDNHGYGTSNGMVWSVSTQKSLVNKRLDITSVHTIDTRDGESS